MYRNVKSWQQTNPDNPLAPWMRSFLCDRRSDKKIFVALVYVARSLVAFYVKPWAKLILKGRGRWCDDTHYGYIAYYGELQLEELCNHKQRPKSQTGDLEPQTAKKRIWFGAKSCKQICCDLHQPELFLQKGKVSWFTKSAGGISQSSSIILPAFSLCLFPGQVLVADEDKANRWVWWSRNHEARSVQSVPLWHP